MEYTNGQVYVGEWTITFTDGTVRTEIYDHGTKVEG